jgi:hypothetical protein
MIIFGLLKMASSKISELKEKFLKQWFKIYKTSDLGFQYYSLLKGVKAPWRKGWFQVEAGKE